jgi:glycosyltransferase involved in cell wall biosynthesis
MQFLPCAIIPIFNHKHTISATVHKLRAHGLYCFIVDDGSDEDTQKVLRDLEKSVTEVTLHRLPVNQGKGAAMIAGFKLAYAQGYTHGLQIDADGQHDINDVPRFLELAQQHPTALIAGQPIYDASAPLIRLRSRKLSQFWVYIETLSLRTPDSMCGFRLYPLQAAYQLVNKVKLGHRMDSDTELMVHLIWMGGGIISVPTKVIYPQNNISHFRYLRDNVLITRMHFRLFFGMLRRLPVLLYRKFHKPDANQEQGSKDGTRQ